MAFHINDKKDGKKGAKPGKGAASAVKSFAKQGKAAGSGGGKKMLKTGGTRGS